MSPLYEALCDLAKARDERNAAARLVKVCPMNGTACADASEESRCSGCASVYLFRKPPSLRELFEVWASDNHLDIHKATDGGYFDAQTAAAWFAWQGCAEGAARCQAKAAASGDVRDAARQLRKALGISQDFDDWPLEKLLLKAAERIAAFGAKEDKRG